MSEAGTSTVVEDVTCLACGCLCDDLAVEADGDRIVGAKNACQLGRSWLLRDRGAGLPDAEIDGEPASIDEALGRALAILGGARAPLIVGLSRSAVEAAREALAIADHLGAVIDPSHSASGEAALAALRRSGRVSATLGEVRDRADLVIFWGCDPVTTHPRHLERYSAEPRGRFVPDGRAGRTLVAVGGERAETAKIADIVISLHPDLWLDGLSLLRARVRSVAAEAPPAFDGLLALADRLKGARYGAFFHGPELGRGPAGTARVEAAFRLVRDVNEHARCVALALGGPGNPHGIGSAIGWASGYPSAIDFGTGVPRSFPGETSAAARLARGECDAALVVGEVPPDDPVVRAIAGLPVVVVAPDATAPGRAVSVAIATATPGIDGGGTVARSDGAWLPLRPPLRGRPTEQEVLRRLRLAIEARAGGRST